MMRGEKRKGRGEEGRGGREGGERWREVQQAEGRGSVSRRVRSGQMLMRAVDGLAECRAQ